MGKASHVGAQHRGVSPGGPAALPKTSEYQFWLLNSTARRPSASRREQSEASFIRQVRQTIIPWRHGEGGWRASFGILRLFRSCTVTLFVASHHGRRTLLREVLDLCRKSGRHHSDKKKDTRPKKRRPLSAVRERFLTFDIPPC